MNVTKAAKLTVYVGDAARYGRKPLYQVIVKFLREEGIQGATVLNGIEGYGSSGRIHTVRIVDLWRDLPKIIVAVDRREKIEAAVSKLERTIRKELLTIEDVEVVSPQSARERL